MGDVSKLTFLVALVSGSGEQKAKKMTEVQSRCVRSGHPGGLRLGDAAVQVKERLPRDSARTQRDQAERQNLNESDGRASHGYVLRAPG